MRFWIQVLLLAGVMFVLPHALCAQPPVLNLAPTISNIPDVIIGDAEGGSVNNDFTYPDAFNADSKVSDDNTSDAAIRWTFQNPGGHYKINNHLRTDGSVNNLLVPSPAYSLTEGTDDPASADNNLHTLTFRNVIFSPVGGPNANPGNPGIVSDAQTMTLVASDGTTYTQSAPFTVYVLNDGFDALSGSGGHPPMNYEIDWSDGQTHGWVQNSIMVTDGGAVILSINTGGLCADASAQGPNVSGWASQRDYTGMNATYNSIALLNNAVYQVRMTVSTSAQAGLTPMWFFNFQNTLDWYGGCYIFFDNGVNPNAGNNAPAPAGMRSEFIAYINAPALGCSAFQTEAANPANANFHDFRLRFTTLDIGVLGNDPYGGALDQGTICWRYLEVNRYDNSGAQVLATPYNLTNITQPVDAAPGVQNADPGALTTNDYTTAGLSTVSYAGGDITIRPTSASAWENNSAFFQIQPGDGTNKLTGAADMLDNYPVSWSADQLYRIVYTLQAPDELSETNPPDFIMLGGDCPTNELITNTYVTTKLGLSAMPKQTPQEYIAYWAGNGGTSAPAIWQRMRPHLSFGTNPQFMDVPNSGGLRITAARVELVNF